MSHESERELFERALAGEWQARVDLYRKLFHENPGVRRWSARYPNEDEFLHDCFTIFLRAGRSFRRQEKFGERADAVAAWIAVERDRLKEGKLPSDGNLIRMCAVVEGDPAVTREQSAMYVPPGSGPEASLRSRISGILGESQLRLLCVREAENATWEDTAAAAGRTVNSIGPTFVHAANRLSRFFGAPPHMNSDLEAVFSEVSANEAAARRAEPLKPRGRMVSMQLDPLFYAVTPELRKIGISAPGEVRTVRLWDAARASSPPGELLHAHLAKCRYCSDVLRSMLLMQDALRCTAKAGFRFCPDAATLLGDSGNAEAPCQLHLAECGLCRDERNRALESEGRVAAEKPKAETAETGPRRKIAWVAAVLLLCGLSILGLRHVSPPKQAHAEPVEPVSKAANPRYADLVQRVFIDDKRLFASVLPQNQFAVMEALGSRRPVDLPTTKLLAERLANQSGDPGAQMLFAECLYTEGLSEDGYREMQKAEAMLPRNSFRCWATLQSALTAGDKETAEREINHLSTDPNYAAQAKTILTKIRAR